MLRVTKFMCFSVCRCNGFECFQQSGRTARWGKSFAFFRLLGQELDPDSIFLDSRETVPEHSALRRVGEGLGGGTHRAAARSASQTTAPLFLAGRAVVVPIHLHIGTIAQEEGGFRA
jgi:hypothetical protein